MYGCVDTCRICCLQNLTFPKNNAKIHINF